MPETYSNPLLFVAQMKVLLPIAILILVALFLWATYEEKKQKKKAEVNE